MSPALPWNLALELAAAETQDVLRALPDAVRQAVAAIPIVFERRPGRDLLDTGVEPDTLGLFLGASAFDGPHDDPLPPRILLFLEPLWEEAGGNTRRFRREIRLTLLHEIGHGLGLEEDDLEARGLE